MAGVETTVEVRATIFVELAVKEARVRQTIVQKRMRKGHMVSPVPEYRVPQ